MIKYILIYPAVGRRKIGPVEIINHLEGIVWEQAAKNLVKVISVQSLKSNTEYCELIATHSPDGDEVNYRWSPVKDLSIISSKV